MKTILITSIVAITLTQAAHAKTWAWFHGDIGVASSPFVSSSAPATNVATQGATKKQTVQKRAVAKSKPRSTDRRITQR